MRINERNLVGPSAPEAGRTKEALKSEREGAAQTGAVEASPGGDHVELSSTLGRLSQAISNYAAQRASHVEALATDYQSGRYQPDAAATSQAMIAAALGESALPAPA